MTEPDRVAAATGAIYLGTWPVGSPAWHEARRDAVGGSEVAPILGLSPWDSYFSLWHRKAGSVGELPENPEMRWGKLLEDVVCAEFAARHPELDVCAAGTYAHPDRRWQIANPDRVAFGDQGPVVVEAKTSRDDLDWGEEGTDQVPLHYRTQVLHYLDVFDLPMAHLPVLIAGSEYREYVVRYDADDAAKGREASAEFVNSLREGRLPDIDAHTATYWALREMHPDIDDERIELPANLARDYEAALSAASAADEAKSLAVNRVLAAMGRSRRAMSLGRSVAIRVPGRGDSPPFLRPTRNRKDFT